MSTLTLNDKVALLKSNHTWSDLSEVAGAVAEVSERPGKVYVERLGEKYRWGLAHKGGAYPLLRSTAAWLEVDYKSIYVGFATLEDGTAVLREGERPYEVPDAWVLLSVGAATGVDEVGELIRCELC